VEVRDADVCHRVLGGAFAEFGDLSLDALVDLLDPARVDAPVQYQRIQGETRGLAPYRIENNGESLILLLF
jgi:hypothetical protein